MFSESPLDGGKPSDFINSTCLLTVNELFHIDDFTVIGKLCYVGHHEYLLKSFNRRRLRSIRISFSQHS
jgi:hypothetical protein